MADFDLTKVDFPVYAAKVYKTAGSEATEKVHHFPEQEKRHLANYNNYRLTYVLAGGKVRLRDCIPLEDLKKPELSMFFKERVRLMRNLALFDNRFVVDYELLESPSEVLEYYSESLREGNLGMVLVSEYAVPEKGTLEYKTLKLTTGE